MKTISAENVLVVLNEVLGDTDVTIEQVNNDLTEMGMDSVCFIQIIVLLEETFDCEIPDSKLLITEMDTVQKMVDVLQELSKDIS